jgi:hypothetical protein
MCLQGTVILRLSQQEDMSEKCGLGVSSRPHFFKTTMTSANYEAMGLDELRQYILTHRDEVRAFHLYVDRFSF